MLICRNSSATKQRRGLFAKRVVNSISFAFLLRTFILRYITVKARVRRKFLRTLFIKGEPLHVMNISLLLFEVARSCRCRGGSSRCRGGGCRCRGGGCRCRSGGCRCGRGCSRCGGGRSRCGSRSNGSSSRCICRGIRKCVCCRCALADSNHHIDRLSEHFARGIG